MSYVPLPQAQLDELIANAKRALAEIQGVSVQENSLSAKEFKQVDWTGETPANDSTVNCSNCNGQMPFTFGTGRPAVYCSDACKMKAYRKRKKALRKLHSEPEKPLRISKRSNVVDLSTAGKVIGVSGTVHKFPLPQLTVIHAPAPYVRSFTDLQVFLGGAK